MPFVHYSADVKFIVIRKNLRGETLDKINNDLGLNISTDSIIRWLNLFHVTQRVLLDPAFYDPRGRPTVLSNEHRNFIQDAIDSEPTLYLDELAHQLAVERGINIAVPTLAHEVRDRLGLTLKVAKTVHPNQDPVEVGRYLYEAGGIDPACLVFLDESSFQSRRLYRRKARAPRGERTKRLRRTLQSRRFSLLPAICLSGCLGMVVLEGSIYRDDLEYFLSHHLLPMMNPYPAERSVLVLDNAPIHHGGMVQDLCEQWGVRILYLPPYGPEFNPIEKAFDIIKARLRRSGDLHEDMTVEEEAEVIYRHADDAFTPELIGKLYGGSTYL